MHKIISPHGDYDNMGEVVNFIESFKIAKVIFNYKSDNDLESELV